MFSHRRRRTPLSKNHSRIQGNGSRAMVKIYQFATDSQHCATDHRLPRHHPQIHLQTQLPQIRKRRRRYSGAYTVPSSNTGRTKRRGKSEKYAKPTRNDACSNTSKRTPTKKKVCSSSHHQKTSRARPVPSQAHHLSSATTTATKTTTKNGCSYQSSWRGSRWTYCSPS